MQDETTINKTASEVLDFLQDKSIAYHLIEHPPALTMNDLAAVDQELGADHPKNLFLCNRQKTVFYLLLMPADKLFKTASVSKQLQVARLSFAGSEHLERLLQTTPGAISPLGLVFDRQHVVQLLVDRSLRDCQNMVFHPCINTASLVVSGRDFFEVFLPATGHQPVWINIEARSGEAEA
ncbi:MAG: prolyl-tRNA synthetase associated domain-containing protein [Ruminococcaceae bacterium]|jgi:Ala-tRNA(Pro) deacylase|nr:prolyl-tRNA synthetase associated domain-containing protein [Oscillospiraceae bacterium]